MGAVAIERPANSATKGKEKVRGGMVSAVRLSRQVFERLRQKQVLVSVVLIGLLVASSIGVVVSAHENRTLFSTLSSLQAKRDQYHREWSQLLLEQSALSAHGRVEKLAAQRFDMVVPGREDIVLVPVLPVAGAR
ncbi:cell division protein FtsL [Marinobacter sp. C2H3]|uniref:cell division protein FtsL n=1 Tax=Marinobacter sp. C2H3 TaxID=3119003 RepID=UPI00300EE75A